MNEEKIFRISRQYRGLRMFERCYNRVVADLNFLNWYRSFRGVQYRGRIWYNPNPAPQCDWNTEREKPRTSGDPVRILFARRFVPEKGTRLIGEVLKDLLALRPQTRVTLAGEDGPEKEYFQHLFSGDERVTITSYDIPDALSVHRSHDIAVIPSVCGEATSFSVSEAMATGCAVVATNMGGTITQVIDGYSGLLCFPEKKALLEALLLLIDHPEKRAEIQKNGWALVQTAFSLKRWRERWKEILAEVVSTREATAEKMRREHH